MITILKQEYKPIPKEPEVVTSQRLNPNLFEYIAYMKDFTRRDWVIYTVWIGMMLGLGLITLGFLLYGQANGILYPSFTWLIPIGIFGFTFAISFDNIAHTTIYKKWNTPAEYMIHNFTTASGIISVLLLIVAYGDRAPVLRIPIYTMVALSIIYSLIDEAIHWIRYSEGGSGTIEVTMHFLILVFHPIMIISWLIWFEQGYQGYEETLTLLGLT